MKKSFWSSFRTVWLATGIFSLLLPFFLPSIAGSENLAQNTILVVNFLMFALSLPCSLFGLPVVAAANYYLQMSPDSIEGMYLNTFLFFVLGFVQWFWIARVWQPIEPPLQMLDLACGNGEIGLPEASAMQGLPIGGREERTPIERVFDETDSR